MKKFYKQRATFKIEISLQAKASLEKYCEDRGKILCATISRIVQFFGEQSEIVQGLIQGDISADLAGDVARLILQRMSARVEADAAADIVGVQQAPIHIAVKEAYTAVHGGAVLDARIGGGA